jgi:signal transduction histidine kinase
MSLQLRALLVEDDPDDAELLIEELTRSELQPITERVTTEAGLRTALVENEWDIILSDFSLPQLDAYRTLHVVRELEIDIPVIVVSGSLGEERAVSLLRSGASDFVLKDRLARLVPAIERERRDSQRRAEQRKLREQLMISDRMASIGMISAGVAHEINNPLSVLLGTLDLLDHSLKRASALPGAVDKDHLLRMQTFVVDASEAAERIRQIADDIRSFSRSEIAEKLAPVSLNSTIASSLRMASTQVRHRARIIQQLDDTPDVMASEGRLGQVLLNLLVNAAQAIPEGEFDRHHILIKTRVLADTRVEVSISDTGSGISKERLERIFDPFYTTKPAGQGTGLGLAICRRIVEDLGGQIEVESVQGTGTTFRVILPQATEEARLGTEPPHKSHVSVHPVRGRVLVVDDETALVTMLTRAIDAEHDVVGLTDSTEALKLLERGDDFDVILCDIVMPKLSGTDLFMAIKRRRPELAPRFLFMSGAYASPQMRSVLEDSGNAIVQKPFEMTKLMKTLRNALTRQQLRDEREALPSSA